MNEGLTWEEARERLKIYGRNEIRKVKKRSPLMILLSQFTSPIILILIIAAFISLATGFLSPRTSFIDSALILLIVLISGVAGFLQEYKSEKTIEALQKMAAPKAKVVRSGRFAEIEASQLAPGDLILLETGDVVPADAKLIEAFALKVDEASLTGESIPVGKRAGDEVYMNTFVNTGRAKAIVKATGMATRVGRIAGKLEEIEEEATPFQKEMAKFSRNVTWAIIFLIFVMSGVSFLKYELSTSLLLAVSLAVAAIPEGLPAVLVLSLTMGAKAMAKRNALVRRLAAIESIGAVDVICTDKTGTITESEMRVTVILTDREIEVEKVEEAGEDLRLVLMCSALCNNSKVLYEEGKRLYSGDKTEIALRKVAEEFGFVKEKLDIEYRRVYEIPFTSERKMMSVVVEKGEKKLVFSKGAPEILILMCSKVYHQGKVVPLDENKMQEILRKNESLASKGLRVLGFAFKELGEGEVEENLVWLGLQGMIDPPRKEVYKAIEECKTAGIRAIMITGDNPLTAKAIAEEVGLESSGVVLGSEIDKLSNKELEEKLASGINIFARTSPMHKLRILEVLQKDSRVAMAGDGVNDALALKKADVGIAMGTRGTEVAKEASDIILLDDNFASIVAAVREGRRIFDNLRKFINYLFTCNFAEVAVIFLATIFLTLKEPVLLPLQLLWINLVTDGLPALALGIDPASPDIMNKPPRKKGEGILSKRLSLQILIIGIELTALLFLIFFLTLDSGESVARTAIFTGFVLYEFARITGIRFQERLSLFSNKLLILSLVASLMLQLLIVYTPANILFHIEPLGFHEWIALLSGFVLSLILAAVTTPTINRFVKD